MVQSWVRRWLVQTRFRRTTVAGKKAAMRAAALAWRHAAAVVIQKYVRRRIAQRKVMRDTWCIGFLDRGFVLLVK